MNDLNLAVIGNCSFAALIDAQAKVVWMCLPRLDGDPVFCSLLEPKGINADRGFFDIELVDFSHSEQRYLHNSAILVTRLYDSHGCGIEITDFAPRFKQYDRMYRPLMLVRHIQPLAGNPRIRVRLRPTGANGAHKPTITRGSNHIRYVTEEGTLRLTTDAPPSYIAEEVPFVVEQPITMVFGDDESLRASVAQTARNFYENTREYWREWTRYLSIPFEWQAEVIRAAVTLKLCSQEETGAIVAAITTSIPEAANTERNWDYRFCWLRDSYFVVNALNRLGATRTMEDYLYYMTNVIAGVPDGVLQPVYGIMTEATLRERTVDNLAGYRGMGPVRVGNQAYDQVQNDVYGSVILALTQIFFDRRLHRPGNQELFERLEELGDKAIEVYDTPDAGLWELRNTKKVHTFSSVMCWAAADRLGKIAAQLGLEGRAGYWSEAAATMHKKISAQAWNGEMNCFVESFGGKELDAALLLLHELGFLEADDPRFINTVDAIGRSLRRGDVLFRYAAADDFGHPENAFNICTFWYIEALASIGRDKEARRLFENMLAHRNPAGLFSEDLDPVSGELWGNFPQTYSMVGLISSAMRLSKSWEDAV
ncbi:MAG: glycoside hydrolase family 15 protein [Alphaproteobacteria bacterium]